MLTINYLRTSFGFMPDITPDTFVFISQSDITPGDTIYSNRRASC